MSFSFQQELTLLNEHQKRAVGLTKGRLLILAGAGSGKTKVLTLRMAHLIQNLKVSPKAILGLTFTNKAAAEMRERLCLFIPPKEAKQVMFATFHSFCMHVLRQDIAALGYTTRFSLYDEQDIQRLIHLIARDLLTVEGELPSLSSTVKLLREAKNKGVTVADLQKGSSDWHQGFATDLFERLNVSMKAYNAVDFDHLLSLTVELFERFPEVLAKYQERFQYVMIDEYQDTNPIQYLLAHHLTKTNGNLCVVGDDDQSIYGWRGADIKNILSFEADALIKLEQNYRSTNSILKAANAVIANNQNRHSKALWSTKEGGEPIELFHTPGEIEEAETVVKKILKLKEELELNWGDFAILYRSNALSRVFEQVLLRHTWKKEDRWIQGIPFQVFGGQEFYERKEIKDLCAYLRIVFNSNDQEALLRVINQPRRGIGEESLDKLTTHNRSLGIPLWDVLEKVVEDNFLEISQKALEGIKEFISTIGAAKERFSKGAFAESMEWFVKKIDYDRAIKEEVKSQQMRDFKQDNVRSFISSLADFEKAENEEASLEAFVSTLALDRQFYQEKKGERKERVNLMTFHSAKGLEFPVCFLVGLEDHIIPHEKSVLESGVEEERRLMYVAITRAKERLFLSLSKQRKRMGKESASRPSRFLYEIPKELLKLTDWRIT